MRQDDRPAGVSGGTGSNLIRDELQRFNEERRRLLGNKPIVKGERMPLPYTYVGGDVPDEAS